MLSFSRLIFRSLKHYWLINLSVTLAAAVGVAVLTGSLLVGASVRQSLHDMVGERLGPFTCAVQSDLYFREELEPLKLEHLMKQVDASVPAILLSGSLSHADSGARAGEVSVVSTGPLFWKRFDGRTKPEDKATVMPPPGDSVILNQRLADEISAEAGDEVLLRVESPSAVGRDLFLGERDETVDILRLTVTKIIPDEGPGAFSLEFSLERPLNIYLPLETLQKRFELEGRVNTILSRADLDSVESPQQSMRDAYQLSDLGLSVIEKTEPIPGGGKQSHVSLESSRIYLQPHVTEVAAAIDELTSATTVEPSPTLTYLANEIRIGSRSVPYSVVVGSKSFSPDEGGAKTNEIFLNQFAADDLKAKVGDAVGLTYYLSDSHGELVEKTTTLTLARIVPMAGPWTDPSWTPAFPGLGDANRLTDWDAPFPLDHGRIRQIDEDYWDEYKATPKAFVSLETARTLWANQYGDTTAIRYAVPEGMNANKLAGALSAKLHENIDPELAGLHSYDLRLMAEQASKGSSDFGGLFIGFSLFILISVAALIQILFRVGVESRSRQFGLLGAVGFSPRKVRRQMLGEGAVIAGVGGVVGLLLAVAYGKLMVYGLNNWWVGSIGSSFVRLNLDPASMVGGLFGGWFVAMLSVYFAARRLSRIPAKRLLSGHVEDIISAQRGKRRSGTVAIVCGLMGAALLPASIGQSVGTQAILFFSSGGLLLTAGLALFAFRLRGERKVLCESIGQLGRSSIRRAPGRSLLVTALVASATFLIVAVGANRQVATSSADKGSGTGGFAFVADASLPIYQPLDIEILAEDTGEEALRRVSVHAMRVRDGDDASCRNLYQAKEPRILGVGSPFIQRGGFAFAGNMAEDEETKANPWLLLNQTFDDGAIPVIGDYTTIRWLLHLGIGKDLVVGGQTLQIVAMLHKSVYQSELIMSEGNFRAAYPLEEGWRSFALDLDTEGTTDTQALRSAVAAAMEYEWEDQGLDLTDPAQKLNDLMQVENTYLATFQSLGGLGLLLGTLGLALALFRNLIERRRELALLRALGFRRSMLVKLAVTENLGLLVVGMVLGTACALLAISPALIARAAQPDWSGLLLTLAAVFLFGLLATVICAMAALRTPMIESLKEE